MEVFQAHSTRAAASSAAKSAAVPVDHILKCSVGYNSYIEQYIVKII